MLLPGPLRHPVGSEAMSDVFITLFDNAYLHHGLALHRSLRRHAPDSRLAVIAMDDLCLATLRHLALPRMEVLDVESLLDAPLRAVRLSRTRGEFCWTLSPLALQTGLRLAGPAGRAVYVDADLWFTDDPRRILDLMGGASIQLTEHGFPPDVHHQESIRHGRFCVQFVAATGEPEAARAIAWWRDRCTEWCHDRVEPGRFGDQKYLDQWPGMLGNRLQVPDPSLIAGPWNMRWFNGAHDQRPVAMHFHGWKALPGGWRWIRGYRIPTYFRDAYAAYQAELEAVMRDWLSGPPAGWRVPIACEAGGLMSVAKRLARRLTGREVVRPLLDRSLRPLFRASAT